MKPFHVSIRLYNTARKGGMFKYASSGYSLRDIHSNMSGPPFLGYVVTYK